MTSSHHNFFFISCDFIALNNENNKVTFMTSNPRDQKGNLTKQDRNNML